MAAKDDCRIFVGGLAYETDDRVLQTVFARFGKVLDAQIITERETGRPRGFGFVTYTDRVAVEAAIAAMNNVELDGRLISVNRAEPKPSTDESYGNHNRTAPRGGGYRDDGPRGLPPPGGWDRDRDRDHDRDECFKCGRPGHWARDCPSSDAGGGGGRGRRYTPPSARYGGGGLGRGAREDRFGGPDRYGAGRFYEDRYDSGPYDDRDRMDRYSGGGCDPRDRYVADRYGPPVVGDRFSGERYGDLPDRYSQDDYGKERGYDRDFGHGGGSGAYYRDAPRGGAGYERNIPPPRMAGGPARYEGGGNYRDRPRPYDHPRGGRSNFDRPRGGRSNFDRPRGGRSSYGRY